MPAKKPAKSTRKPNASKPKAKPAAKTANPSSKASPTAKRPAQAPKPALKSRSKPTTVSAISPVTLVPRTNSKQSQLIAKLSEDTGLTIPQMVALTGWQAHSLRGTISGVLRKKLGLNVTCSTFAASGERIYRINQSAPV